jgi:glyoxylase-like metal-dependent hydrolase (beta-lactamase superfamily II)
MCKAIVLLAAVLVFSPLAASAQGLDPVATALGAANLRSIQIVGSGTSFAAGQAQHPGAPWPRFNVKSLTRDVNYETAALRDDYVRTQAENPPRGGGLQPVRGEGRQILVVRGDHAWNVVGDAAIPAPIGLAERQLQLWSTPHGVIKAAMARGAVRFGKTISFTVPGRFALVATLDDRDLIERVDAVLANPVVGDMPVEITYGDYRDVGGVKFPMRIRQSYGGFPTLDLTITEVKPNGAAAIEVPDSVRQATGVYSRVANQMVADGVWYITGGSHHSVAIEMRDHVIVVEGPLNDERALAVIAEVRSLAPGKPIRYVIASHAHFDHSGGLRAFAGEGATIVSHEVHRAYFDDVLAAPATVAPDHLSKSRRQVRVEGVRDRRTMTDGTRTVDIYHIAGVLHDDGLLMVHLPKEKLLIQADTFTPLPSNTTAPPTPPSPFTVGLADNIARLNLAVDQHLPLHGRIVPMAELLRTIGR